MLSSVDTCTTFDYDFVVARKGHFGARTGRLDPALFLTSKHKACDEFTMTT